MRTEPVTVSNGRVAVLDDPQGAAFALHQGAVLFSESGVGR
jgi:hypothetical protein